MNYPQEKIKPYNADEKKSVQVEKMFDNIAPAYDQLNHALSWNIDKSWRRKAINWLKPFHPQHIMDVATGTGDFAIQACQTLHPQELIGTDISEGMMNVGREKVKQAHLSDKISFARCIQNQPRIGPHKNGGKCRMSIRRSKDRRRGAAPRGRCPRPHRNRCCRACRPCGCIRNGCRCSCYRGRNNRRRVLPLRSWHQHRCCRR